MKRLLSLLMTSLLLITLLSTGVTALAEDVTITYISSTILESPEGDFEQSVVDAFNALDNGITVEVEGVGANELMKKYITLATADQMPDFFLGNMLDAATVVDMGLATPLTEVFDQEYIDGFDPKQLGSYTIDGVAYGAPWFGSAQGIVYRKDLFEAAGIEKLPETWDELVAVAQQLTDGENQYGITLVATKDASGAGRFQYVLRNHGVDEFIQDADGNWTTDIGGEKYIQALQAYTDLDVKYGVVPPGAVETGYSSAVGLFSAGQACMLITGSNAIGAITAQVPELKGKLGSFPIPAVERSVSTPGGFGFYISPGSEHKAEAAAFIQFLLESKNALAFSEMTGRLPTRTEQIDDPIITEMPELAGFMKALENVYVVPTIPGYSEVNDIHGEAYQSVLTGMMTVEEAAARAQQRSQELCDRANAQ